jgi:hypothetical protein
VVRCVFRSLRFLPCTHPSLLAAVANYYLTFSIIISIVGDDLVNPNSIAGGDPTTVSCWAGSFLEDTTGDAFDWLALVNWLFKVICTFLLVSLFRSFLLC